ncbi:hypothetical protein HKX48_005233 [Thoreauomyces humboldtii]|nr:hypothetical protein HKX48_005233 [Thoreauomyces humboldtii]
MSSSSAAAPALSLASNPPPADVGRPSLLQVVASGAIAGSIADTTLHPLDLVKTRMQKDGTSGTKKYQGTFHAFRCIRRNEGVRGLRSGMPAAFLGSFLATGTYFASYESFKRESTLPDSLTYLLAAALGETLASVAYVPSEVVKTRMQLQGVYNNRFSQSTHNYKSDWDALRRIGRDGRLWKGWGSTLARDIPCTALQFTIYETIRAFVMRQPSITSSNSPFLSTFSTDILPGAAAGFAAGFVTTPLDVIKTTIQTQARPTPTPFQNAGPSRSSYYTGFWAAARGIGRRRGIRGLFAGDLRDGILDTGIQKLTHISESEGVKRARGQCMKKV